MTPNMVAEDQLSSALSLNQVMWNTCMIAGPALGGVLIAKLGVSWAYAVDVLSFAATITACVVLHPQVPRDRPPRTRSLVATGWQELAEGVSFLRGKPVLQATFYVDLVAMIFGMPRALFPVLAVTRFGGGSEVVGLLFSSAAIGAVLGALTGGWVRHVRRQGLAVLWAVFVWGLGIIAFGLSGPELGVAVACLGGGRRGGRHLRRLPGHDPADHHPRCPPRPLVGDPHARRGRRPPDRRLRGGRRRDAVHADRVGGVGWGVLRHGRRRGRRCFRPSSGAITPDRTRPRTRWAVDGAPGRQAAWRGGGILRHPTGEEARYQGGRPPRDRVRARRLHRRTAPCRRAASCAPRRAVGSTSSSSS